MDPNETLTKLRKITGDSLAYFNKLDENHMNTYSEKLLLSAIDHIMALDNWLSFGGHLPEDWEEK